ncbi:MAG: hypothetical protein DWQ01_06680 [Planctomycetota bacterium]|nr:MAG: hypothetical protein DWQ01_06680 [Planctomycetota bacterium]
MRLNLVQNLAAASLLFLAACSATPLLDPEPFPTQLNEEVTREAVIRGMAVRGWVVEEENPGRVLARLNLRSHVVKVLIRYDEEQVSLEYSDSANMDYQNSDDGEFIHKNYNSWVRNLAGDIQAQLSVSRLDERFEE